MQLVMLVLMPVLLAQAAPAGLDHILRGAQPGMSLEAFREGHPNARELAAPDAAESSAVPAQRSLAESFEQDPLLGLACHTNYGFKDGMLVEFVVLWGGDQEAIKERLRPFLQACTWKHGQQFRKDVMQVNLRAENPTLVPVLVWEMEDGVYLASLAWNPDSTRAPGTLTYALYPKDDPFLDIVLLGEGLAPEVLRDAHAELDPILQELAVVGTVPE